jgi:hypothetical protein
MKIELMDGISIAGFEKSPTIVDSNPSSKSSEKGNPLL